MSTPLRFALPLLGAAICSSCLPAQQEAPSAAPSRKVLLDVVVAPHAGAPVAGLKPEDFTVLDNNHPRPIASFAAYTVQQDRPEVVFVIDRVNTNFANLSYVRQQLGKFLRADGGHLALPTSLAFLTSSGLNLLHEQSTDGNSLASALNEYPTELRNMGSPSEYQAYDRLQISTEALQALATREAARPGRKIVVWISPGWPLDLVPRSPGAAEEQRLVSWIASTSALIQRANITLYSIDPLSSEQGVGRSIAYQRFLKGVTTPAQAEYGDLGLQVLAVQSGGLALTGSNNLPAMLARCLDDTTAYYEISFNEPPAKQRDEYHQLEVKLANPALTARTRTGQYESPNP